MPVVVACRTWPTNSAPIPRHQSARRTFEPGPGVLGLGEGERARQDAVAHVRRVDRRHCPPLPKEQAGGESWSFFRRRR